MSTEPTTQEGLNWSPPEPTPTVGPGDATTEHPAGTAAPGAPADAGTTPAADGSPLDAVIAKLPPAVSEKPEALVGVAFGAGLVTAILLKVVTR